jgi:hypothetical protein
MSSLVWIAVALVVITSTGILLSRDWRVALGLLGLQYAGTFWLTNQHWPVSMAAIKLVTGWMSIVILGMTHLNIKEDEGDEKYWPQGWPFRLFAGGVVVVLISAVSPRVENVIPGIGLQVVSGSLILIGMGILHLGMTAKPFRVILGLLTVFSGFESLYAALESSILIAAMLSTVNLGLALVGAYLLTAKETGKSI